MPNEQANYAARRTSPSLWLWVLLVCVLAGGVCIKIVWDIHHRTNLRLYEKEQQVHQDLGLHYQELFYATDQRGMTESEVRAHWGIPPFDSLTIGEHDSYGRVESWSDPRAGFTITFSFDEDRRLVMYWSSRSRFMKARPSQSDSKAQRFVGGMGLILMPLFFLIWFFGLLLYAFSPGRRAWLSLLIVCCGSLLTLCWLMGPGEHLDPAGLMQKEERGAIIFVALVTAIAVAIGGFRNRFRDPFACDACGYSLRSNLSGICPECGRPVSAKLEKLILEDLAE